MTVQVTSAIFSACVTSKDALPTDGLPIIALVGRSNVGKSSLINTIAGRRELAKTSSTPGKTLTINFYQFNEAFYIVDLPGYGYAKASKVTRERIQKMMDEFFESCPALKAVIQILDMRHAPSSLDKQMFRWIQDRGFRYMAVMNKADKLSNQQQLRMFRQILKDLHADAPAVMFSTQTSQGRDDILEAFTRIAAGEDVLLPAQKPRRGDRPGGGDQRRPRRDRPQGQKPQNASARPRPQTEAPGDAAAKPAGSEPTAGQGPAAGAPATQGPRRPEGQEGGPSPRSRRRDRNRRNRNEKPGMREKPPAGPSDQKPQGGEES
ncbi:MAG TPA: ribosome biogenesis GTP-binding protein YihA/YsxC [Candidatus Ozemobacteraceae bacterium]|nr:ribosome biogenesis GTP-binding protein YihA/YsxC [Candidatus Ozemobacteraceae bacterium]